MGDDQNINSLKKYDGNKVAEAVRVFHDNVMKFDGVAIKIDTAAHNFKSIWSGKAYEMFIEKFEVVYGQVTDISDSLYKIYEMLQTAQDTFYQADDSLDQQLKQQQAGGGGGGSSSGGGTFTYEKWSPVAVGEHNTPEAYVPNVALPPMSPLPVLHSTMGESYDPQFVYAGFTQMPVVGHSVPSAYTVNMLYSNMTVKEVIAHNVGEAANVVLEYDEKALLEQISHDVPEAYKPEFEYADMAMKEVVPHDTPEAYVPEFSYAGMTATDVPTSTIGEAYFPTFEYMTTAQKERLMNAVSIAVTSEMTRCVAAGMTIDEAKLAVGEAVVNMLSPTNNLTGEARTQLVSQMGNTVFDAVCGGSTTLGEAVSSIAARDGIQWSRDAINGAVSQIMAGAAMPACTIPTVADSVTQGNITTLQPQVNVLWNANGKTLVISASNMLGDSGTEGMNAANLSVGIQKLSSFSIRMSTISELGSSVETTPVDTAQLSDLQIPVITITPSVAETTLSSENGEFVWTLSNESSSLLNSAIVNFTENPTAISAENAELLQKETVKSINASAIQMPQISIAIA